MRLTCKQCGVDLPGYVRRDTKFCGATCRKAYSRRGNAAKRATETIMSDLQTIRQTIKKHPDLRAELNEKLKRIKEEVIDVLRLTDNETIIEEGQRAELISNMKRDTPA